MDVPSNINVDNWETNDNFIIPLVQEQESVTEDGLIKSSVDIVLSDTITTMEGSIITQESVTVGKHHGNGIESSFGLPDTQQHTEVVTEGYIPMTGTQLENSFMMHQYGPVENIPLPPEIGTLPSKSNSVVESNVLLSGETVVGNEMYVVTDPSIALSQDHFSVIDKAVTSSHLELTQGQVFIGSDDIPQTESVEYISPEVEPTMETAAQYPESAANVEPVPSRIVKEKAHDFPVTHVTIATEEIVQEINVPAPENTIPETSVPLHSILYKESDEITPTPLYETFEADHKGGLKDQPDSVSLPVAVDNYNVGESLIDLVLPVVDAASVTMPDPVSLRPKKPMKDCPKKDVPKDAPKDSSDSSASRISTVVPPQVVQLSVPKKPATVAAPIVQKPRTSLKGIRNLSSHIVTKDELAKELQERSKRNFPNIEVPGGDILFTKTMTKRLASNIHAGSSKVKKEMEAATVAAKKPAAQPPAQPAADPVKKPAAGSGDDELLAILEGEVDDWSIDQPPPQLIEAARSPVSFPIRNDPPKLDPAVEREMALKQLNDMPASRRLKKPAGALRTQTPHARKYKLQPKKEYNVKVPMKIETASKVNDTEKPLRKRKIVEGVSEEAVQNNGESIPEDEGTAKVPLVVKAPRIFKTKKSLKMTNGAVGTVKKPAVVLPSLSMLKTDKDVKLAIVDINHKPNTSPDKTAKPVKKSEEETDAVATTLVSPPRTYSSRIKKSTYSDDFVFPSTSKSRVVPIVGNSSAPKESKPPKTPKPAAAPAIKVKPAAKGAVVIAVAKKRGRPKKTPVKKPGRTEIDRLLQDEGAINMLYSVEQDEEKRRTGSAATRYSHRDLLMRTQLVKSAVQRLTNSPSLSLRHKRATATPVNAATPQQRKMSFDSSASLQSPPSLTPIEPSSPTQIFTYPPRLRPPAEASRIIRRHSSSSNFSSRSASPNSTQRLSVDAMSPRSNHVDMDEAATTVKESRKRGAQIYIRKSEAGQKPKKKKRNADGTINTSVEDSIFKPRESSSVAVVEVATQGGRTNVKGEIPKNFLKGAKKELAAAAAASKVKKTPSTDSARSVGGGRSKKGEEEERGGGGGGKPDLTTCLAEAVTAFIAEDGNLDSSSLPPELPKENRSGSPSPPFASISYASVLRTLEQDGVRRAEDAAKERSSPRQSAAALAQYKELSVRRHDNLVQVMIAPVSTKLMNSLNPQVLRELRDVLSVLRKDDSCRAVLVTSTGSSFCLGVDFHSLIIEKADRRKAVAQEFALALKQFMAGLSQFNKPIIAGVHGAAIGLGVTMLPFFDMVFASDKATFYTPYARLGQAPEGAAVVTMPQLLGNAVTSELLYACRKLTATEALHYGLVTRILWPEKFQEELLSLIRTIASQSAQSMEATKALLRFNLRGRVDAALEAESSLLVQHWTSAECQSNFKRFLDDEDVGLQRQRVDA